MQQINVKQECPNCQGENAKTGYVELWDNICPECGRNLKKEKDKLLSLIVSILKENSRITLTELSKKTKISISELFDIIKHDIQQNYIFTIKEKVKTDKITVENFTKVNHDINGNPRYVLHFLRLKKLLPDFDKIDVLERYSKVVKAANKLGGKKFHNKQYGGGIVFQSYNLQSTCDFLNKEIEKRL